MAFVAKRCYFSPCRLVVNIRVLNMITLRAPVIVLIAVIGTALSHELILPESLNFIGENDVGYRPWTHNDNSTIWISLEGMGISSISSAFRLNIPDLRWLVMDNNQIQVVPSDVFRHFPDLTYLSLAGNQISQLELGAFNYLQKLQVLDLSGNDNPYNSYNSIRTVSTISTLDALERLYLGNCQLDSFDLPVDMQRLSHLDLSRNTIKYFYASSKSSLTHLDLSNNHLRYMSLNDFESLVFLNVSNNWLDRIATRSNLPPAYFVDSYDDDDNSVLFLDDAPALQYLIASENNMNRIDPDTFMGKNALIHVDLSGNLIKEVYAGTFENLSQMEDILLDSNNITKINHRAFVNLPNLKTISIKNNLIDDVGDDAFMKLNSMANEVHLFLDNNQIHTLSRNSFRDIRGLKHIGLSGNRIKTIASNAFVNLPNLNSVVIEDQSGDDTRAVEYYGRQPENGDLRKLINSEVIESNAFFNLSSVTSIIIRGNGFTKVGTRAFDTLPSLITLDLSNNNIERLDSRAFFDLSVIHTLILRNNSLNEIEPETIPKHVKYLDLAWNHACPHFSCYQIGDLDQLEELDISGVIERFTIEDLANYPKNLTLHVAVP